MNIEGITILEQEVLGILLDREIAQLKLRERFSSDRLHAQHLREGFERLRTKVMAPKPETI